MSLFRKKAQTHQKAKPHQKASGLPWIAQTTTLCSKGVRKTSIPYTNPSRNYHRFKATEPRHHGGMSSPKGMTLEELEKPNRKVFDAERASIAAISFVPDKERRVDIYQAAADAKTNPSMCSKNLTPPASIDDKVDPSQSRLVLIATKARERRDYLRGEVLKLEQEMLTQKVSLLSRLQSLRDFLSSRPNDNPSWIENNLGRLQRELAVDQIHLTPVMDRKFPKKKLKLISNIDYWVRHMLYMLDNELIGDTALQMREEYIATNTAMNVLRELSLRENMIEEIKRQAEEEGTIFVRDGFAVVASRRTPLLNGSNGPNGVLTNFDGQDQRINLFDTDDATTKNLLDTYLAFRDANKKVIFDLTLAQMAAAADDAQDDYITTVRILTEIQQSPHFDDMIGVVSFCQTWATRKGVSGPQFSIESPTFQTRFFIKSLNYDLTMTEEESAAYVRTVGAHDKSMAEYKGKFVHLDDLQKSLTLELRTRTMARDGGQQEISYNENK